MARRKFNFGEEFLKLYRESTVIRDGKLAEVLLDKLKEASDE